MQYNQDKTGYPPQQNPPNQGFAPQYVQPPQYAQQTTFVSAGYTIPQTTYVAQTYVAQPVQTAVVVPTYRPFWYNATPTTITSDLRNFLMFSGLFYLFLAVAAIGLEISIVVYSYRTFYTGFWMGAFVLGSGISMLIAACQASYILIRLIRMLTTSLVLSVFGVIFAIVDYVFSNGCTSFIWDYNCDTILSSRLKLANMIVTITILTMSIVNMTMVSNRHRRSLLAAATGNPS